MREVMQRVLQAARFERDAYVWMDFNDRATGDALVIVIVSRILLQLGFGSSLIGLATSLGGWELVLNIAIIATVFWLAYSGLVYAIGKYLLGGEGSYATILRIAGFAYPTLLLVIFTARVISNPYLALVVGAVWFMAIVAQGVRHTADLPLEKAAVAAGGGLVAWIIVASILGRGLL
jgi:hypothetical protein